MINEQRGMMGSEGRHHCCKKWISWTAVIAGALVGMGLSFLVNTFNIAIGLTAFITSPEGLVTVAMGGFIGLLIGTIVSMFVSGWVSGFIGSTYTSERRVGFLYGFLAWCLALIIVGSFAVQFGEVFAMNFSTVNAVSKSRLIEISSSISNGKASEQNNTARRTANNSEAYNTDNQDKAVRAIRFSLLLTFLLFFIGAASSCLGGYIGLNPERQLWK